MINGNLQEESFRGDVLVIAVNTLPITMADILEQIMNDVAIKASILLFREYRA